MPTLDQVVDRLVPTLMHFGPGPYWVGLTGPIGRPAASPCGDEIFDEIRLCFFRGAFGDWVPEAGCSAVIVVTPCEVAAQPAGAGFERCTCEVGGLDPNGVLYIGVARSGEAFAVVVGPDGPVFSDYADRGAIFELVRDKFAASAAAAAAADEYGTSTCGGDDDGDGLTPGPPAGTTRLGPRCRPRRRAQRPMW